ncbi:MAG TPA: 3'-5' exonuclease [Opitutaceae bacterium]|nr:3'-5' exonuclease [Opitutaceae bacterium]
MHWRAATIHFVDFEGSLAGGVVEYGIAALRDGEVFETVTRLCRPSGPIRREDAAVHGIGAADVAGAAPLSEDWELFSNWRQRGPFAAHFAGTENSLLKATWPYGRSAPDFSRAGATTNDWGPWIDTGRLLPQLFHGIESARLEDLVTQFGLQPELDAHAERFCPGARRRYHAALYDALAAVLLLRAALVRPEFEAATVPWLLELSSLDPARREARRQGELF